MSLSLTFSLNSDTSNETSGSLDISRTFNLSAPTLGSLPTVCSTQNLMDLFALFIRSNLNLKDEEGEFECPSCGFQWTVSELIKGGQ